MLAKKTARAIELNRLLKWHFKWYVMLACNKPHVFHGALGNHSRIISESGIISLNPWPITLQMPQYMPYILPRCINNASCHLENTYYSVHEPRKVSMSIIISIIIIIRGYSDVNFIQKIENTVAVTRNSWLICDSINLNLQSFCQRSRGHILPHHCRLLNWWE